MPSPARRSTESAERGDAWFPSELAPWRAGIDAATFDADRSLVLRDDSGIAGWLLVVRTGPATAHIAAAWVHPDLQRRPPYPPLVALCVRALEAAGPHDYTTATWSIRRDQPRMAAFNKRQLRPYAAQITHERVCGRDLRR